jgi:hypothetical protein
MSNRAALTVVVCLCLVSGRTSAAPKAQFITSCGAAINEPGTYHLAQDLVCPDTAITINASDVDLHLNGHTIVGPSANNFLAGIVINGSSVSVHGAGTVTAFDIGVWIVGSGNAVTNLTLNNVLIDIEVDLNSNENVVTSNRMTGTGGVGILVSGTDNVFKANHVSGRGVGISVGSSGNLFQANSATGSVFLDVRSQDDFSLPPLCSANIWKANQFGLVFPSCIE